MDAIAYVAAGGRSSRMGKDKALLSWGSGTLLEHVVGTLRLVCRDVRVLTGSREILLPPGTSAVRDVVPDLGPIGALLSALADATPRPVLLLAVDLPLVPPELLRHVLASAPGFDAVVPSSRTGPEPLCAFYDASCLRPVEHRVGAGERHMRALWRDVAVRSLEVDEIVPFGDPDTVFANLNTPEDFARFSSRFR